MACCRPRRLLPARSPELRCFCAIVRCLLDACVCLPVVSAAHVCALSAQPQVIEDYKEKLQLRTDHHMG